MAKYELAFALLACCICLVLSMHKRSCMNALRRLDVLPLHDTLLSHAHTALQLSLESIVWLISLLKCCIAQQTCLPCCRCTQWTPQADLAAATDT